MIIFLWISWIITFIVIGYCIDLKDKIFWLEHDIRYLTLLKNDLLEGNKRLIDKFKEDK